MVQTSNKSPQNETLRRNNLSKHGVVICKLPLSRGSLHSVAKGRSMIIELKAEATNSRATKHSESGRESKQAVSSQRNTEHQAGL